MKKGFTLLELLAVIIILAVIALIATPVVLNLVENAKKGAFQNSAYGIAKAIEYDILSEQLSGNSIEKEYLFPDSGLDIKGSSPKGGTATVDKDGRIQIAIHDGKWCATKDYEDSEITITEYAMGRCGSHYVKFYNGNVNGIPISLVTYKNEFGLFIYNYLYDSGLLKINSDSINLSGENGTVNGTINSDETEVEINIEGMNVKLAENNDEYHDIYYEQSYGMSMDIGMISMLPHKNGNTEFWIADIEDDIVSMDYGSVDNFTTAIKNNLIYYEGQTVGAISLDGTQILISGVIFTLGDSVVDSWLTMNQEISGSMFEPTMVTNPSITLSGMTKDNHNLSSVTVNGMSATLNNNNWSISIDLEKDRFTTINIEAIDTNGNITIVTKYICYGAIPLEINSSHLEDLGYKGTKNENLIIPETFTAENGNIYKVASIDGYAFEGCSDLVSITIPKTVRFVGAYSHGEEYLISSENLKSIIVDENSPYYKAIAGVLYWKDMTRLITYPAGKEESSFVIPDTVTSFTPYYTEVFYNNKHLKSITFPSNFMSEYDYSYSLKLSNLESVIINDDNSEFMSQDGIVYTKDMKQLVYYPYGKKDTSLIIPEGVQTINSQVLDKNPYLQSITISDTMTDLGDVVDHVNYKNLKEVNVKSTHPKFMSQNGIVYSKDMTNLIFYPLAKKDTSFTIPSSVTKIEYIANNGITNLNEILVDGNNETFASVDGILYNKDMKTILIYPKGKSNTTFTIPSSVVSIGEEAFYGCTNLINVTISGSVVSIGNYAFRNCTSLNNIIIPDSVTSIGVYAFADCESLMNVTLSSNITKIESYTFAGCKNLTNITIPNGVVTIADGAFTGCDSLNNIIISNGVTTIGNYAFSYCSNLKTVVIPNRVETIGNWAFEGCTSLVTITIPNSLISMGSAVFSGCTSLASIQIPSNITKIGGWMFYDCTNLETIVIPSSVTTIEDSVFRDCINLKNVYYEGTQEQWNSIAVLEDNEQLDKVTITYNYKN